MQSTSAPGWGGGRRPSCVHEAKGRWRGALLTGEGVGLRAWGLEAVTSAGPLISQVTTLSLNFLVCKIEE